MKAASLALGELADLSCGKKGADRETIGPDSAADIEKADPGHEVIGPDSAEGKSSTELSMDMTTVVRLGEQGKFVGGSR